MDKELNTLTEDKEIVNFNMGKINWHFLDAFPFLNLFVGTLTSIHCTILEKGLPRLQNFSKIILPSMSSNTLALCCHLFSTSALHILPKKN